MINLRGVEAFPESAFEKIKTLFEALRNSAWLMNHKGKNSDILWLAHQNFI